MGREKLKALMDTQNLKVTTRQTRRQSSGAEWQRERSQQHGRGEEGETGRGRTRQSVYAAGGVGGQDRNRELVKRTEKKKGKVEAGRSLVSTFM